jgi:hypothetical protein
MPCDDKRFPQLIQNLYRIVGELEAMFPGRPFTPDGHMVGSLAECFAEYYYGLNLYVCSYPGHDAHTADCDVEIKATQGNSVSLRSGPDPLLVLRLLRDGSFEEIYNGPGAKGASLKKGAVPIILLDGESIVDLMIEKQFGVQRQPLELYLDEIDRLFAERE